MGVSPTELLQNTQQPVFRERQESEITPVRGKGGPLTIHVLEVHWENLAPEVVDWSLIDDSHR